MQKRSAGVIRAAALAALISVLPGDAAASLPDGVSDETIASSDVSSYSIAEPGSLLLLALGLFGVGYAARRRSRKA